MATDPMLGPAKPNEVLHPFLRFSCVAESTPSKETYFSKHAGALPEDPKYALFACIRVRTWVRKLSERPIMLFWV